LHTLVQNKPDPVVPPAGYGTLAKFSYNEAWYGMYFQEDKIGYSHFIVEPSGENFTITSDSLMRLTAMKETNEISMKERVVVKPDLTMVSFKSLLNMNGKELKMVGDTKGEQFVVEISVDGETRKREFPLKEKIYHASSIALIPPLRGLGDGKSYSYNVYNAEKQVLVKVTQLVTPVTGSPGPNGAVWRLKSEYGPTAVDSWLDAKGLTVLEKSLQGSLITMVESKSAAEAFQKKKSPGRDLVLDLSLIRVDRPIPDAEKRSALKVRMKGIDSSLIASDHRQKVQVPQKKGSEKAFEVTVLTENLASYSRRDSPVKEPVSSAIVGSINGSKADPASDEHLGSTLSIQTDHKEIVDQAKQIVSPKDPVLEKVVKLVGWTAKNIYPKMRDSFTALAVLRSKEGECQSHANLYTALARSQGIPSRVVTGLVYSEKMGFLYHAWTESFVNKAWLAVDPILNQVPADATHIKIAVGKSSDETASLFKMVGKVKMEVLEFK